MAVGELIPGYAAWLRSLIPGSFMVVIVGCRSGGPSAQPSGKEVVEEEVPALGAWSPEQERTLGEIRSPSCLQKGEWP